jgi:carbamoylphosphate synthase large subunit
MEHIEPCGVHSGDSNATLPPFNLGEFVMQQIKDHTQKIALALRTVGLINIQFAIKDDTFISLKPIQELRERFRLLQKRMANLM